MEARLDDPQVQRWASAVSARDDVQVYLPRYRIETDSLSLRAALVSLGMGIAFSDGADFTAMCDASETPLKIDDVIHRVFVELNEEGTEAAAATAVTMVIESASIEPPPPPPRFEADHPFLFFLREPRTGAILFAGRVVDPAS
jgi:serpin B